MNKNQLYEKLVRFNEVFKGWDFSYITESGRAIFFPTKWDYAEIIKPKLVSASSLLDMGTGGGEFLSSLKPLPIHTYATECYEPNIKIAKDTLEPLGVTVYGLKDESELPFEDNSLDLIINRHEEFKADEVKRILKPSKHFITQQVGGLSGQELNAALGAPKYEHYNFRLDTVVNDLTEAGFKIEYQDEDFSSTRFFDIEAIVYYLQAIPWQVENFTISKYIDGLYKIYQEIQEKGHFDMTSHRLIVIAKKY